MQVCRACGLLGYYDYKLKKAVCSTCKNGDSIATLKLPYACKLLFQVKRLIPTGFRLVLPLKLNSPLNITTLSCNSLVTGTAVDECCSASCSKGNVDKL